MGVHKPLSIPKFLLVKEPTAAHMLQISERAMWALAASGAIPFVKIGRSKRYDVDDLRAVMDATGEYKAIRMS